MKSWEWSSSSHTLDVTCIDERWFDFVFLARMATVTVFDVIQLCCVLNNRFHRFLIQEHVDELMKYNNYGLLNKLAHAHMNLNKKKLIRTRDKKIYVVRSINLIYIHERFHYIEFLITTRCNCNTETFFSPKFTHDFQVKWIQVTLKSPETYLYWSLNPTDNLFSLFLRTGLNPFCIHLGCLI